MAARSRLVTRLLSGTRLVLTLLHIASQVPDTVSRRHHGGGQNIAMIVEALD
jgi:hypothetical protein